MAVAQDQELITVQEAAKRYGVTTTTVYAWINSKLIRKFQNKVDKRVYVDAREIDDVRTPRPVNGEDEK